MRRLPRWPLKAFLEALWHATGMSRKISHALAQRAGGLRPLRGDRRIRGGRQLESGEGFVDSSGVWQAKEHGEKQFKLKMSSVLGTDF